VANGRRFHSTCKQEYHQSYEPAPVIPDPVGPILSDQKQQKFPMLIQITALLNQIPGKVAA
jgi:hypothetical protein